MKIRTISYGYEVKNGKVVIKEEEAEVVRSVFMAYISSGSSLKRIADTLTKQGVTYYLDKRTWNKNMVSRILENIKYTGKDGYPMIVSDKIFGAANERKEKTGGNPSEIPEAAAFMKRILVCDQCGGNMGRRIINKRHERWVCPNGCCIKFVDDKRLFSDLLKIINRAIGNPELFRIQNSGSGYSPTIEIIRQAKEIDRLLEQKNTEFGIISKMVLECASLKYDCCPLDKSRAMTDALIDEYSGLSELNVLNIPLIQKTVRKVHVKGDGSLRIKFINDAMLSNSKEEVHMI